jgi:glutamate carboxypeptidase
VNIARLLAGTHDFVDALPAGARLLGTSSQRNVVPDRAVVEGEARFLSPTEGSRIIARLAALADRVSQSRGVTATLNIGTTIQPVDPRGAGAELVGRTVDLAAARGFELEVEEDRGGVSFPNFLVEPSRIPVVDGLGPVGGGMHTRDEFVDLSSLARRSVLLADLLASLSEPSVRPKTRTSGPPRGGSKPK